MLKIKVLSPHSEVCREKTKPVPSLILGNGGVLWRDSAGRQSGKIANHRWISLICNDVNCGCKILVRLPEIEEYVCQMIQEKVQK